MMHADDVKASIKICMFDQYGTVVDMQTGLTEAAAPFLAAKGWQGDPNSFVTWWRRTHFENSMIDCAPAPGTYLVSRDRPSLCRFRPGARRYFLHARRGARPRCSHRAAAPVSGGARGARSTTNALSAGGSLQWRSGHAGNSEALPRNSLRPCYLGRGCQCLQATCRNVHKSSGNRGSPHGRGALHRQSRLRLHRR